MGTNIKRTRCDTCQVREIGEDMPKVENGFFIDDEPISKPMTKEQAIIYIKKSLGKHEGDNGIQFEPTDKNDL